MQTWISRLFAACLLTALPSAAASRPELYGTWQLDSAASRWGSEPETPGTISGGTLTVEKHHKTMHMAVTVKFDHGERTDEMDWRVDNRYHPISGPASGEILAKWDGATLVGEREMAAGHDSIRLRTTDNGATLTETIHHTGASGTWDRILVWTKR